MSTSTTTQTTTVTSKDDARNAAFLYKPDAHARSSSVIASTKVAPVLPPYKAPGRAERAIRPDENSAQFPSADFEGASTPSPENPRGPYVAPRTKPDVKSVHIRARSATTSKASIPCEDTGPTYRRVRASSTMERTSSPRFGTRMQRGPSPFSRFMPSQPAVSTSLSVITDEQEPLGSFAPTSRARPRLQSLLFSELQTYSPSHTARRTSVSSGSSWLTGSGFSRPASPFSSSRQHSPIPSISRTPSPYTDTESLSTAPSSTGPPTPARSAASSPTHTTKSLHSVLESLEDSSKFRISTCCATCKKSGTNFPCCPKCGEMWCSRACRLQGNEGKRHRCGSSRI